MVSLINTPVVLAISDPLIAGISAVLGAALGATGAGIVQAWTARTDRHNTWLQWKRGNSRGYLQHIAVHHQGADASEEDVRLIGHYYTLALAVRKEKAAQALFNGLPEQIRSRVDAPNASPLRELREEVAPERIQLAAPDVEAGQ